MASVVTHSTTTLFFCGMLQIPEILFYPAFLSLVPGGGGGFPGLPEAVRQVGEAVEADGNRDILSALVLTGGCSCIPGASLYTSPCCWCCLRCPNPP